MQLTVSLETSLGAISTQEWSELARGASFYVTRSWVLAMSAYEHDLDSYLVLVGDGSGRLVGALPCHLVGRGSVNPLYNFFDLFGLPGGLSEEVRDSWCPQLIGGPTSGYGNALLVRPGLPKAVRQVVVRELMLGFSGLASRLDAACAAIPFLDRRDLDELRPHLASGDLALLTLPCAKLALPGDSFDEYCCALRASRRRVVQRDLEEFTASGCTVRHAGLGETIDIIAPLLAGVQRRHGSSLPVSEFRRYLECCALVGLDDLATVFIASCHDDIVAFAMGYQWENGLYMRVVGMDYVRHDAHACYRHVLYHEPIRFAARLGLSHLDYGVMAYRPKLIRGCELHPLWSVLMVRRAVTTDTWQTAMASWNESRCADWAAEFGRLAPGIGGDDWLIRT